jgi:outer membrane protein
VKYKLLLLAAGMAAMPAFAQRTDTEAIPDLPLRNIPPVGEPAPPPPEWKVTLGGGVAYVPRYEGAAANRLRFMPLLEATNGRLFISPIRGIGYNFSHDPAKEYGVRLTLGHPRWENADPRLAGMGNIGYSVETGLFLNMRFAPWYISSGLTTGVHGTHAELGGGFGFPVSAQDRLRFGVNMNWGNDTYNQTYFSVNSQQAFASNGVLTPYSANAGIKDYALTANWAHNYTNQWFSSAGLSIKRLAGSAANSPLTVRRNQPSVNFQIGYRF